ncbi:hypothetical protein GGTG_04342 [Gaeumannomyces tritici R3-111a-1]|uniref:Histidine acid phosphatase n=1 Tax=Gaeumannomyces tritici (strain R3-111a-1) TaxID=644352 RepID=J3NSU3_GAET3|nr:hypothetical protein GGTG_04342 [Gaeumannomyces tritici R3-111a-1]EJT79256.1 hypothetical protein GGTG_04342 [Gaeumannomyces tritici R3-111a-1]
MRTGGPLRPVVSAGPPSQAGLDKRHAFPLVKGRRAMPRWELGSSATRSLSPYGLPALLLLLVATTVLFLLGFPYEQLLATTTTTMWAHRAVLLTPAAVAVATAAAAVDLSWHASGRTPYNNLSAVVGGEGVPKFVFEPSGNWEDGTSNWCNMPHVRPQEYVRPSSEFELKYVEVIHRHHKRTPYSSNAFPVESYRWNCDDQGLFVYGQPLSPDGSRSSAQAYWQGAVSPLNTFVPSGWVGTCQFPQITTGGLDDSARHGDDLYAVYHTLLGLLPDRASGAPAWRARTRFRVTQNVITSQVAGMLVAGMTRSTGPIPLEIQAAGVDSLEPQYPCPAAAAALSRAQTPAADPAWAAHLAAASPLYTRLDDISGVPAADAGFHKSLDHYFDNLSARQCHAKPLPCKLVPDGTGGVVRNDTSACVDQALADQVYRFGHWEYAHVYRGSRETLGAAAAAMGVWVAELAAHLREAAACGGGGGGASSGGGIVYRHNVAHDGSVSRLLSVLQLDEMVWPGMGSEVVFELWRRRKDAPAGGGGSGGGYFVRTLFSGKVLKSASPALGEMDMLPLDTLLAYFDGLVGDRAGLVVDKCNGHIPL